MQTESRIKRYGACLQRLAAVCLLMQLAWWVSEFSTMVRVLSVGPVGSTTSNTLDHALTFIAARMHANQWPWVLVLSVPWVLAFTAPTLALSRIGEALRRQVAVSETVARRVRQMGYALLASSLVPLLELPLASAWLTHGTAISSFSMGNSDYVTWIAALCVFAVAHVLDEGARQAVENQAFV